METTTPGDGLRRFVTAPLRVQTYKRFLYLLLAFPLGMLYFVGFTVGSSTGVSLLVTLVGVPILLATLAATTAAAGLEAKLSRVLLDRETPVPPLLSLPSEWDTVDSYVASVRQFVAEPTTWTSVAVVLVKFVFGQIAFFVLTAGGVTVVALLSAPLLYDDPEFSYRAGSYVVTSLPEALALAGLGLVGLLVVCNVWNALATAGGVVTDALLSVGRERETT
ncbi:sensor domain-containing protein [Haloarcula sp. S1CR25-12]|uniref:Sensor domain-containing protein n=1 Tax=Haloarcula saliterrae TaxID=2950534 RepID=A0ABU2F955_9EURY|nr:sensor domain-containing protein [Haloarcula sp. S1CR25-12]MDS0258823.1 sensor domain-containing protein [Haloarcula sp. S1CR25-12]